MKYELLGSIITISGNCVHVTSRTRLRTRRNSEAANQRTLRSDGIELGKDAIERAFDRV